MPLHLDNTSRLAIRSVSNTACAQSLHLSNSTTCKPTTSSLDGFLPLLRLMLLPFLTKKPKHKTARKTNIFLYHHQLESLASKCILFLLLLFAFVPNGALQFVRFATKSVFIVFFALQASSSLLGVFQLSSSLLVPSSISSVFNLLLVYFFLLR